MLSPVISVVELIYCCVLVLFAGAFLCSLFALRRLIRRKGKWRWALAILSTILGAVSLFMLCPPIFIWWRMTHTVISGTYYGKFAGEEDTLTLRPDGSFDQRFALPGAKVYITSGKWRLVKAQPDADDKDASDLVTFDSLIVGISHEEKVYSGPTDSQLQSSVMDGSQICFWGKGQNHQDEDRNNCFTPYNQ